MNTRWKRLQRGDDPCPVCTRYGDGCMVSPDGARVLCVRTKSDHAARGGTGWFHVVGRGPLRPHDRSITLPPPIINRASLVEHYHALGQPYLKLLAAELGVSVESLVQLEVGWSPDEGCWMWPLSDLEGVVPGIMRRWPNGEKRLMPGHTPRTGLYLPCGQIFNRPLLIVEGGSDVAAALTLGFNALGRFSCSHGKWELARAMRELMTPEATIVSDAGNQAEREGAWHLANHLYQTTPVRLIEPPNGIKDLRAWFKAGATKNDILAAIAAAPLWKEN